jgi:hypothetical protein
MGSEGQEIIGVHKRNIRIPTKVVQALIPRLKLVHVKLNMIYVGK